MKRPLPLTLLAIFDLAAAVACLLWAGAGAFLLMGAFRWSIPAALAAGAAFGAAGILLWKMRPGGRWLHSAIAALLMLPFLYLAPINWVEAVLPLAWCAASLAYLNSRSMRGRPAAKAEEGTPRRWGFSGVVAGGLSALGIPVVVFLAFIMVPNLDTAQERERSRDTMKTLREVASLVEAYAIDTGSYPAADSPEALALILVPTYMAALPSGDGWGRPMRFLSWKEDPAAPGPDHYAIASAGRDGLWEQEGLRDYRKGWTETFDADVVFGDGTWVRAMDSGGYRDGGE